MKSFFHSFSAILLIAVSFFILFASACEKDNDPDNNITPVWIYDCNGDPYYSKPCLAGDKLIFCSTNDSLNLHTTHCIDRNTTNVIWKYNDSVSFAESPVVYNDLVILGGINPHALNLNNGNFEWIYEPEPLGYSIYNNPLLVGDAVYFASYQSVTKHAASSGEVVWETEGDGWFINLLRSRLVFKNGKLYFCDASYNRLYSFIESTGQIEWYMTFEAAFMNKPFVTDNEVYIGIQDADINNKTLRCYNLADTTLKWGVKLGTIWSDVVVAGDKVYAIGMTTIQCRSAIDGSAIWNHVLSAGAHCEPLVTGDKIIVGYGNGLICLNASTGEVLWEYQTEGGQNGKGFTSPTLDGNRIYVSCADGNVYCFNID